MSLLDKSEKNGDYGRKKEVSKPALIWYSLLMVLSHLYIAVGEQIPVTNSRMSQTDRFTGEISQSVMFTSLTYFASNLSE